MSTEYGRLFAGIGFLVSIIVVYIIGSTGSGIATLIFSLIEWGVYYWYSISFIPMARDVAWAALTCCC